MGKDKKNKLHFLSILLLCIFSLHTTKGTAQDSLSVICFGNSTSAPRKNIDRIYPLRLIDSLASIGMNATLSLSAISGSHSGSKIDNQFHKVQHGRDRFEKEVLNKHPNWVIISFGINDAWQDKGKDSTERIPLEQYIDNLKYYIDALRKNNCKIILLSPNPIGEKYEVWRYEHIKKYALATEELAKEKKVFFVDVWKTFNSASNKNNSSVDSLLLDGMHPNDAGHSIISSAVLEIITKNEIWTAPKTTRIPNLRMGPFVRLNAQEIITVDSTHSYISKDEGKTWTAYPLFNTTNDFLIRTERSLIKTKSGVLILAFINEKEKANWNWDNELHDSPGAILPTYTIRSLDGGKTWIDLQKLHEEWTGAIRDIIETRDGSIVFTSMMMRHNPGHHTVLTYTSNDDGIKWSKSNIIDLGGIGHHAGVTESTLAELKDGRLWMLMRTNFGKFWEAYSNNNGLQWIDIKPTDIDASSAPGMIKRLLSGKLILVWNRAFPEGQNSYPLKGGDKQWSEIPVSNHREALSIMFSDDEGKNWSKPKVIAKTYSKEAQIAYPYVFESKPGNIWITSMYGGLRISIKENDFYEEGNIHSPLSGMRANKVPKKASSIYAPSILATGASNESTIIKFQDGLLKIYFINRPGSANKLMSIASKDGGISWTDPIKEFDLPGEAYYANQLVLDKQGNLHAVFHIYGTGNIGYRGKHLDLWYAKQAPNKAWTTTKKIFDGYVGSVRGFIQLKNGRLLIPMSEADPKTTKKPLDGTVDNGLFYVMCLLSDDLGMNWEKSTDYLKIEVDPNQVTRYGAVEPTAIQLENGKVWMLIRTNKGSLYQSFSNDNGNHWSKASPSSFISSDSPGSLLRMGKDTLLLFWSGNQRYDDARSYANGGREALHSAISIDDGKTWSGYREVLVSPVTKKTIKGDHGTAYPSAVQTKEGKIIFIAGQAEERSIVGFDPKWLFEKSLAEDVEAKKEMVLTSNDTAQTEKVVNFPMLQNGILELQMELSNPLAGFYLALNNHFSVSTDQLASKNAGVYIEAAKLKQLPAKLQLQIKLKWEASKGKYILSINQQLIEEKSIPKQFEKGFNYVRIGLPATKDTQNILRVNQLKVYPTQ